VALLSSASDWTWRRTARSNYLPTAERIPSHGQGRCTDGVRQDHFAQRLDRFLLFSFVVTVRRRHETNVETLIVIARTVSVDSRRRPSRLLMLLLNHHIERTIVNHSRALNCLLLLLLRSSIPVQTRKQREERKCPCRRQLLWRQSPLPTIGENWFPDVSICTLGYCIGLPSGAIFIDCLFSS